MAAYVIAHIEVSDPVRYEEYKKLAFETVTKYGGRYLARGPKPDVLEGDWRPKRLVLLEFPSAAQARTWWESPEYAPARAIRKATCSRSELVIIDGM
jgi:uncharacterized protein (DUF1330 family)